MLHAIVDACQRAPSGDNCQPWRYGWDGDVLTIRHDDERARHPINRGDHGSLLALGCVVESASIAASEHGLRASIAYGACAPGSSEPWATLRFGRDPGVVRDPSAAAIPTRCTDRRVFLGGELGIALGAELAADAVAGTRVRCLATMSDELIGYAKLAESSLSADPVAFAAVMSWVRFTRRETESRRDGMPLPNLGVRAIDTPILWLLRAFPSLVRPLSACGMASIQRSMVERQLRSSAGLVCVTITMPSTSAAAKPHAVIDAGRSAMRAWLRLTLAGFGVQPMSLSSLNAYLASATDLIEPAAAPFFRDGGAILGRAFGFGADELPIWMFRTGRSTPLPERMRTLRLPMEDVLDVASADRRA